MTKSYLIKLAGLFLMAIIAFLFAFNFATRGHAQAITVVGTPLVGRPRLLQYPYDPVGTVTVVGITTNVFQDPFGTPYDQYYLLCQSYPTGSNIVVEWQYTNMITPIIWNQSDSFMTTNPTYSATNTFIAESTNTPVFRMRILTSPFVGGGTNYTYTGLALRVVTNTATNVTIAVTNSEPNVWYSLESSPDLTTNVWSFIGLFQGVTNEFVTNVDSSPAQMFYRAHRGFSIFATPESASGDGHTNTCPGGYIGDAIYSIAGHTFSGWSPNTNTTYHVATDFLRPDNQVQYSGHSLDHDCGFGSITLATNPVGDAYRFESYFLTNYDTNIHALWLDGFNP